MQNLLAKMCQKGILKLQNHEIWIFITFALLKVFTWNFHQTVVNEQRWSLAMGVKSWKDCLKVGFEKCGDNKIS